MALQRRPVAVLVEAETYREKTHCEYLVGKS
jgi:hypothetical protein